MPKSASKPEASTTAIRRSSRKAISSGTKAKSKAASNVLQQRKQRKKIENKRPSSDRGVVKFEFFSPETSRMEEIRLIRHLPLRRCTGSAEFSPNLSKFNAVMNSFIPPPETANDSEQGNESYFINTIYTGNFHPEDLPTHVLSISGSDPSGAMRTNLYPIHLDIISQDCTTIPGSVQSDYIFPFLPSVPMILPHPCGFCAIQQYLYLRDVRILFGTPFMPGPIPEELIQNPTDRRSQIRHGSKLGRVFTLPILMNCIIEINHLWGNMHALGINDGKMWILLDALHQVLLTAATFATDTYEQML